MAGEHSWAAQSQTEVKGGRMLDLRSFREHKHDSNQIIIVLCVVNVYEGIYLQID